MSSLIDDNEYYGTFNLIYSGMNPRIKNDLLNDKKKQNNLLDLESMEYRIFYLNKNNTYIEKIIKIDDLEKELLLINELSTKIWDFINSEI